MRLRAIRPLVEFLPALALSAALAAAPGAAAVSLPAGFQESIVFGGLTQPTAVRFAADGRVFVAEKSGLIKVFDDLADTTPLVFADLRTNVHNFWDRGLTGLALHPDFPGTPYVYVAYTLDAEIGGTPPRWGSVGGTSDGCPNPPGPTTSGCVVAGRLSRLRANGNVMTGAEEILIEGWCQQFPSHGVDSLVFGPDGALYASAGDGASFGNADYGQYGSPPNPCGDPPVGVGGTQAPPTAEGGALRSQSPRRVSGEPAVLNGAILRIDPLTGAALPDNPLSGGSVPNADRIIAYGLRNPFRITFRPGTNEIWIGDVGWGSWEEINRIPYAQDAVVENFGWPCYEGSRYQPNYNAADLSLCESLYATPSVTPPYYTYNHNDHIVSGEVCERGNSSIAGLAFYAGGTYPAAYSGALFFADYSRNCIWAMFTGANGDPDPLNRATFVTGAAGPVDLQIGPGGDLFYVDFNGGTIRRIQAYALNQPPMAVVQADATSGLLPLTVQFDASGSSDPDPGDVLAYAWDLDDDGLFDDSTAVTPQYTYMVAENYTAALRVTDQQGASATASVVISAGNTPPAPHIQSPLASTTWSVGDAIAFSGSATDAEDGALPDASLSWTVIIHHCEDACHIHPFQTFPGVAGGTVPAPDYEYPAHLEIQLSATDSRGVTEVASVLLYPNTVALTFGSDPSGLVLAVGDESETTPFVHAAIVNSVNAISAPTQAFGGASYDFVSWSDGGARSHSITAPATPATYVATFAAIPGAVCGNGVLDFGEQCDDGDTLSGDCCSSNCQVEGAAPCNLTPLGAIVARVTAPTGGGNHNIEVIRDGDKPPLGNADSNRQYETYDGNNTASEDWIGYLYAVPQAFARVVFQEGKHFVNGGWFQTLTIQVRQNGTWVTLASPTITPAYPGFDNDLSYETYTLDFSMVVGDGIRIYGTPGGSADFVSVGELEVYGGVVAGAPTPTSTPSATPTATPTRTPTSVPTSAISGSVRYYSDEAPVTGATVRLHGPGSSAVQTDGAGQYLWTGSDPDTCLIVPEKVGDGGAGVSALDAVYVLQALVGLRALSTEQRLACDVTGNGGLSGLDAALILRYKVGLIARFPVAERCGSDWVFVPVPAPMPGQRVILPQMTSASCQPGTIELSAPVGAATGQDFRAILFGDCTGNW
jgi:cysteine-rich repeat protein